MIVLVRLQDAISILKKLIKAGVITFALCGGILLLRPAYLVLNNGYQQVRTSITPRNFNITCDEFYSADLKAEIEQYVHDALTHQDPFNFDTALFYEHLQETFPVLRKISWQVQDAGKATMRLVGSEPRYVVNKNLVLCEDNKLFSTKWFCDYPLDALPSIEMKLDGNKVLPFAIGSWLSGLPGDVRDFFHVVYEGETKILLQPKEQGSAYRLVVDETTAYDVTKIELAQKIYRDECSGKQPAQKGTAWELDLRYADRVLVRGKK